MLVSGNIAASLLHLCKLKAPNLSLDQATVSLPFTPCIRRLQTLKGYISTPGFSFLPPKQEKSTPRIPYIFCRAAISADRDGNSPRYIFCLNTKTLKIRRLQTSMLPGFFISLHLHLCKEGSEPLKGHTSTPGFSFLPPKQEKNTPRVPYIFCRTKSIVDRDGNSPRYIFA